ASDTSSPKDEWEPDWDSEGEGEGESSTTAAARDLKQADNKGGGSEEKDVTKEPKQDKSSQNEPAPGSGGSTHDPNGLPQPDEGEDSNKTASTEDAAKQAEPDTSQEKDTTQQSQDSSGKT